MMNNVTAPPRKKTRNKSHGWVVMERNAMKLVAAVCMGLALGACTTMANLTGPDSQRMRCAFNLNDPPAGMDGGGPGKCQLANGTTVDATFPRA